MTDGALDLKITYSRWRVDYVEVDPYQNYPLTPEGCKDGLVMDYEGGGGGGERMRKREGEEERE